MATLKTFYLMKVRGKAKIPDYIQLRDENLTLIGYFRPGRLERLARVFDEPEQTRNLEQAINELEEYGRIKKVMI
jgi:hypothetical protein